MKKYIIAIILGLILAVALYFAAPIIEVAHGGQAIGGYSYGN